MSLKKGESFPQSLWSHALCEKKAKIALKSLGEEQATKNAVELVV